MTVTEPQLDLGDRLRISLRKGGKTAGDMADYLGVSRSAVSEWMNGKAVPKIGMLRAWALGTGVDFEWLGAGMVRREGIEPPTRWLTPAADLGMAA